jgi:hypothetical protein
VLDEFLLNSRLWLRSDTLSPLVYFKHVVNIVKMKPKTCWRNHGIDHCFLLLELRYVPTCRNPSYNTRSHVANLVSCSRSVVAEAARDCRRCVITVMNLYGSKGFMTRDVLRYILSCIRMVSDDLVAADLATWLAGHCQVCASTPVLADHLWGCTVGIFNDTNPRTCVCSRPW